MNTLSILDEMWAQSMKSIQLTMSGYCLYFTVRERRWKWSAAQYQCRFHQWTRGQHTLLEFRHHKMMEHLLSDISEHIQSWKKKKKNGTIMFCLPHFHLQKNSQLKPHGWNNINALFRSGEHAHFWINHNPFWKTWKHFFSCLCVSVWTMGTVSKAQTKYPLQMFLLSFWVSSLLQTVFI